MPRKRNPASTRTSRWPVTLFALPFAAIGLGMLLLSVLPTLYDWVRMQSWVPVQAQLLEAELRTQQGGKSSTTYLAHAEYRYLFAGQPYSGRRVAIGSGADNIGDFQQQLGTRLEQALARGTPVTAWVNPKAPQQAVLDRSLRPGLLAFKMMFVVMFGGVGVGILVFVWRRRTPQQDAAPAEGRQRAFAGNGLRLEDVCQLQSRAGGVWLRQKGARAWPGLLALGFTGVVFMFLGQQARGQGAPLLFAMLFVVVGALSLLGALYGLAHSRHVILDTQGLRLEHRLLGLVFRWEQWPPDAVTALRISPGQRQRKHGGESTEYSVQAQLRDGRSVTLANKLPTQALAQQLLRRLGQETGYPGS